MSKATYKVTENDRYDNVQRKSWDIVVDGEVVGEITGIVRDINMCRTNPGYQVVVRANLRGECVYHSVTGSFENRYVKEANQNRAEKVAQAKLAITKAIAAM